MGAIIGGLSGLIVLMFSYIASNKLSGPPKAPPIQEVRMVGAVDSVQKTSTPGMLFPGLGMSPLKREDYSIIGVASGNGCAHYVGLWPVPFFWVKRDGGSYKWFSFDSEGTAIEGAWYGALESLPSADAMLSPRVVIKEKNAFGLWYKRDCAGITGKGIEIKLDQQPELNPTQ
jgi:hypothetical protein